METLTTYAKEESSYGVTASFTDENGNPATPNAGSITWDWTDEDGNPINNREDQAITSASTINIILSGDDLAISGSSSARRILTVRWTYNSDLQANLPGTDHVAILVEELVSVP